MKSNNNSKLKTNINKFIQNEKYFEQEFSNILTSSFGVYAKHIIQNRALPDFKDGLKPVHRRIIYAMADGLKLTHKSNFKKSARIVGEVIGKYHPHGDTSVYAALVRMSQSWKMRYPLISFHGNNGSIDGDPPAAMRYTEVRLSRYAEELFKDTKKELVPFVNNFDDTESEPVYFPGLLPNLFLNGNSGIAAGYSTNIPPHNLGEFMEGFIAYIKNPNISLNEIVQIIKGPDFPTAGIIINQSDLFQIYKTGKGKIVLTGKIFIKSNSNFHHFLEITEIPFDVPKSVIVKQIETFRANQAYDLITKIIDLTDKNGIKIIVEIKDLSHAEQLKNLILKKTFLQIQYSCNFVVIIDSKPHEIGILDYFKHFFQFLLNFHETKYRHYLKVLTDKQLILSGFMKMVSILDDVIATIRHSKTRKDAINNLVLKFQFLEIQATAIVELKLYRLTSTDIVALKEEYQKNKEEIENLKKLLSSKKLLTSKIISKLAKIKDQFTDKRLTEITNLEQVVKQAEDEEIFINKNDQQLIISSSSYLWINEVNQKNNFNGKLPRIKSNDYVAFKETIKYNQEILLLTKSGYLVLLAVSKIQKAKIEESGLFIPSFIKNLPSNSPTLAVFSHEDEKPMIQDNTYLLLITKLGKAKLIDLNNIFLIKKMLAKKVINLYKNELEDDDNLTNCDDEVIYCDIVNYYKDNLLIITNDKKYLLFPIHNLSVQGFASKGQTAIKLKDKQQVQFAVNLTHLNAQVSLISNTLKHKTIIPMNDLVVTKRAHVGRSLAHLLVKKFNINLILTDSKNISGINVGDDLGTSDYLETKNLKTNFSTFLKNNLSVWKEHQYKKFFLSYFFKF
ncbi:DNA gyrase subunit A [Mycoplasma sp. SG1]|uniref:DNA gyrase subunit A n=1 Tax=Mycoplasma sp. SG1 TaxID=2810348 RepID=UPI0020259FF0|nr:DNA gyrase subunit A [Mycoplasma sp. SG1]URM53074.1 hypothetical protein JRW51_01870 [Mycoplasma sp. SG1]